MNAGRTVPQGKNERQPISDADALILKDAYGYDTLTRQHQHQHARQLQTVPPRTNNPGDPGGANDNIFVDMKTVASVCKSTAPKKPRRHPPSQITSINILLRAGNDK